MEAPTLTAARAAMQQPLPADRTARAVEVAEQFETIFVQQMVEGLRRTVDPTGDGGGLFGEGPGSETYTQWFDRSLGEHVSQAGRIGVADAILAQIRRSGQIATPAAPRTGGTDVVA